MRFAVGRLVLSLVLLACPAGAATYVLATDGVWGDWTALPVGSSLDEALGEVVPDPSDYARTENAYLSSPIGANLFGPDVQPIVGSTYVLSVVARAQPDNGVLVVELQQNFSPVVALVPEELTGEWATYSVVLSPAEAAQVATELWTLSVEIVAGNVSYEGPVDVAWVGLTIIEP